MGQYAKIINAKRLQMIRHVMQRQDADGIVLAVKYHAHKELMEIIATKTLLAYGNMMLVALTLVKII